MFCFQKIQFLYLVIQHHLFLDTFISRTECFDLRIIECLLIYVLTSSCRRFRGHDLSDKTLLCFQCLIEICIKAAFGHIVKDMSHAVLVALTFDTTNSLLQVAQSPWNIQIMQCDQLFLTVCPRTHFACTSQQNSHFAFIHTIEEISFLLFGFGIMYIGDLFRFYAICNQLIPNIIIDAEIAFFL